MEKRLVKWHHKNLKLFLVLIMTVSFYACKNEETSKFENATKGILRNMTGFDGCGWIIQLSDKTYLEPINLKKFDIELIDNKSVCFQYHEAKSGVSICMVGPMIEIDFIEYY